MTLCTINLVSWVYVCMNEWSFVVSLYTLSSYFCMHDQFRLMSVCMYEWSFVVSLLSYHHHSSYAWLISSHECMCVWMIRVVSLYTYHHHSSYAWSISSHYCVCVYEWSFVVSLHTLSSYEFMHDQSRLMSVCVCINDSVTSLLSCYHHSSYAWLISSYECMCVLMIICSEFVYISSS